MMQVERHDGTKDKKYYEDFSKLLKDAEIAMQDPTVKKITIWPRLTIPSSKRRT